ncbi:MAG: CBS domain-containing protein [Actinomycetota bacterium]
MRVADLTWRAPVTIDCADPILKAAQTLSEAGVGSLVVVDGGRPVGIVTDRDIVTRCVAERVEPDTRIDSIMSMGVVALDADADVEELYAVFASHAIRRVPLVEDDRVVGMVTLDDAIVSTAAALNDLAGVFSRQIAFPKAGDEPAAPAVPG